MLLVIFLLALAISMDAFSLSLIYGMNKIDNKKAFNLSLLVGVFHVIMPLIGFLFGLFLITKITISIKIIMAIILLIIAIEMILSSFKILESELLLDFKNMILFAMSVSFDSFTIGTSIFFVNNNYILICLSFFIVSFMATFFGLKLGDKLGNKLGSVATFIGGVILILLAIYYLFN